MRVIFGCVFVAIFAAGIALSQDTNFSNGSQYLEFDTGRPIRPFELFRALHIHAICVPVGSSLGSRREQRDR